MRDFSSLDIVVLLRTTMLPSVVDLPKDNYFLKLHPMHFQKLSDALFLPLFQKCLNPAESLHYFS